MDDAYRNAIAVRDALGAKIRKLEQQLATMAADYDRAVQFISSWEHFAGLGGPRGDSTTTDSRDVTANPSKEFVADQALAVLEAAGVPLSRAQLYEALKNRDVTIVGKDPLVVFSTMLWRMRERIPFYKGRGYWFPDRPFPDGHMPTGDDLLGVPGISKSLYPNGVSDIRVDDEEQNFSVAVVRSGADWAAAFGGNDISAIESDTALEDEKEKDLIG